MHCRSRLSPVKQMYPFFGVSRSAQTIIKRQGGVQEHGFWDQIDFGVHILSLGWMKQRLESRQLEGISITSDMQVIPL